jgi:hypothetical protein
MLAVILVYTSIKENRILMKQIELIKDFKSTLHLLVQVNLKVLTEKFNKLISKILTAWNSHNLSLFQKYVTEEEERMNG